MTREIATVARDVTAPLSGYVLRPRDEILTQQGGALGLALYDSIRRDPHVRAVLYKRKAAVVAREWEVVSAGESPAEQAAADLVREALKELAFDRLCLGLLNAQLYGYAVAELVWGARRLSGAERLVPTAAKIRNSRRFVFDREERLRLLTPEAPSDGIELPDRKFVVLRHGEEESEDPYGLGLGHYLFWPTFFKRQGIAFWMTFTERFAAPTALAQYPTGTPEEEQQKLLAALRQLSNETGIIMPAEVVVKLLEAQRAGSIDSYERLCRYMDEQISEAVLGETLSTNIGQVGSHAAAETHNEVRGELTDADADLLSDVLNATLVAWICEVNLPGAPPPKVWRVKPDEEDLAKRAERDERLVGMGFRPTLEYVITTYGGEWVEAPRPPAAPASPEPAFAAPAAPPPTPAELIAARLEQDAQPGVAAWLERIEAMMTAAGSLEEFREMLLAAMPELPSEAVAEPLALALQAAAAAGASDVEDESG